MLWNVRAVVAVTAGVPFLLLWSLSASVVSAFTTAPSIARGSARRLLVAASSSTGALVLRASGGNEPDCCGEGSGCCNPCLCTKDQCGCVNGAACCSTGVCSCCGAKKM